MANLLYLHPIEQSVVFNVQVISGVSFLRKEYCFIELFDEG